MKKTGLLVFVFLFAGCARIHPPIGFESYAPASARQNAIAMLDQNLKRAPRVVPNSVAVKTFTERGTSSGLGLAATEFFSANLSLFENITLIDRSYTSILEMELEAFDPARQRQVLAAEQLLGGYTTMADGLLNVSLYTMPAGQNNFALLRMTEGRELDFFRLIADLNIAFFERNGIAVSRAMAERMYQVPTENIQAYVLYAQGRQAEYAGDYQAAAEFYRQASQMDAGFEDPEQGMQRVSEAVEISASAPASEGLSGRVENPVTQAPTITERSAPLIGKKGTVIIEIEVPNSGI